MYLEVLSDDLNLFCYVFGNISGSWYDNNENVENKQIRVQSGTLSYCFPSLVHHRSRSCHTETRVPALLPLPGSHSWASRLV